MKSKLFVVRCQLLKKIATHLLKCIPASQPNQDSNRTQRRVGIAHQIWVIG
jgi:hypothetical protein